VALWRNYICIGFAFSAVSDEGGDAVQGAAFSINNFRDLFRSILPFLNNDVKVFREPAETALAFVPLGDYFFFLAFHWYFVSNSLNSDATINVQGSNQF